MNYQLTPAQEQQLQNWESEELEESDALIFDESQPKPTYQGKSANVFHERLYALIWEALLNKTLCLLRSNIANSEIPWQDLEALESKWEAKPPKIPAFQALEQGLTGLEVPRQHIISVLLVGCSIWFHIILHTKDKSSCHFEKPTDSLVKQLAEYRQVFETGSCSRALQRLYSLFKNSSHLAFDCNFLMGQIDHSLQQRKRELQAKIMREQKERKQREIREQREREERRREEEKRREEEQRAQQLRKELHAEAMSGVRNWYVGTIQQCIKKAMKHQDYDQMIQAWLSYAKSITPSRGWDIAERREMVIFELEESLAKIKTVGHQSSS